MPRAKVKPKRSMRQWFVAAYKAANGRAILEPKRGGRVIVVDLETFEEITNAHDSGIMLRAKPGDFLILCGPTIEETAGAAVIAVEPLEWRDRLHIMLRHGAIHSSTVHVTKAGRVE